MRVMQVEQSKTSLAYMLAHCTLPLAKHGLGHHILILAALQDGPQPGRPQSIAGMQVPSGDPEAEHMAEEQRLAHVAATRPKQRHYISYCRYACTCMPGSVILQQTFQTIISNSAPSSLPGSTVMHEHCVGWPAYSGLTGPGCATRVLATCSHLCYLAVAAAGWDGSRARHSGSLGPRFWSR